MQTRQHVFLWALYDFANSLVSIVFFLYFAQWIVIDRGFSDLIFNTTFSVSAILLLITAPLVGAFLDKSWRSITGLRTTTLLTAVFYGFCALCAVYEYDTYALLLFTAGLYTYLLSFSFYTPLLNAIAKPEKRGLVSGIGIAANYLGQLTGLVIALPFATGYISFFGANPRAETLLPAVIVSLLFSLPTLLFFEEPVKKKQTTQFGKHLLHTLRETKQLFATKALALFLVSFFFFNDAMLTLANNFPIFLEQVWNLPDTTKTAILLGILVTSCIGGIISGPLADTFGHKRSLMWILASWLILLPLLALTTSLLVFVILAVIMGLWFGASWTVSRSLMSHVAPHKRHNLAFTYYSLAERASSFVGPLVWGGVLSSLTNLGSTRYRIAALTLTLFIALAILALTFVKEKTTHPDHH